jgi:AcrR family transcriptional regulator
MPVRMGRTKRISAGERRTRILDAAVEVFAERGYEAATMIEIARRAGVVASVIYDHFASKRELHIELLELHGQRLVERSIRYIEGATAEQLVHASIETYFELVEEDPFVWRFMFRDPPADSEIASVWRKVYDHATEGIAELIRLAAGETEPVRGISIEDANWILARASQAAINGVAAWWYENREVPRERVIEVTFSLLWEGFERLLEHATVRS